MMILKPNQIDAIRRLHNGCILDGGMGTGKSLTSLGYYYIRNGGTFEGLSSGDMPRMQDPPKDLYIITTARKRDTFEWESELSNFCMGSDGKGTNSYSNKIVVDSWNNIKKYTKVVNSFFIFDEQRVVGDGVWSKSFLRIAKSNEWILLSATPGDSWKDYCSIFIANGFFKTKGEFERNHVIFNPYVSYKDVKGYMNEQLLRKYRDDILVYMESDKITISHKADVNCEYNRNEYRYITRNRWNIYKDKPIENAAEYCYTIRRLVNSDPSRMEAVLDILAKHPKVIIFYNFDFELDILKEIGKGRIIAEWNGHKHEPIPKCDEWVYLVNYAAGSEGWNCIETDTMIFYSQNYSWKTMTQASGRINRMNTPFKDLYYYHLRSNAPIDISIHRAITLKKEFNESKFYGKKRK